MAKDSYNVAPRHRLPVIYIKDGRRVAELMQWGFVPPWSKDPSKGPRPINTKAENAFDSPMWRSAMLHHRCLVPARGFYEWKRTAEGRKVPYFIRPKDIDLFSFAGIYSVWHDVEGLPLYTFSIITTAANKDMAEIHDRMPVILRPEQEDIWLDPTVTEQEQLVELFVPYPDGGLAISRVSEDVNSPRVNDQHLVKGI